MNLFDRLLCWLHSKLIAHCQHPDDNVAADILEGSARHASGFPSLGEYEVQWCRTCGAYRHRCFVRWTDIRERAEWRLTEWRAPRPEWKHNP